MMTPLKKYRADLSRDDFYADTAQKKAVHHTQRLFDELLASSRKRNFFTRIARRLGIRQTHTVKGIYLWGGVGVGKTYLVDTFHDCLPYKNKQRIHFYRFMQMVHRRLHECGNIADPLQKVADTIAADASVLCLDEFHVVDITDAMLLGGLLKALFERGVVLVATSNEAPDRLYAGGLQRERFLPAIELIKTHTEVVQVDAEVDYRLRYLDDVDTYYEISGGHSPELMQMNFNRLATGNAVKGECIEVEGRMIRTIGHSENVVWFEFDDLCDGPRGVADYIHIARTFQTIMLSNVPVMDDLMNDQAKRFMSLIDEFYDCNVKLIITAEASPSKLYTGKRLDRPFLRTASRLQEMRTRAYLTRQHI